MEEHHDDSSHYEVSLTATQALIAFVLLLLSLGASFGFGIMVGRGGSADRLVVQREPAVVSEGAAAGRSGSRIVELGVRAGETPAVVTESAPPLLADTAASTIIDEPTAAPADAQAASPEVAAGAPFYAQLLSTGESKSAEALAVRLIERGFPTAFVDQASTDQGTVYRVRVKFADESSARAAVEQLKSFAPGEVWITSK